MLRVCFVNNRLQALSAHTLIKLVQSLIQAQTKAVVTVPEVLTLAIRVSRMVKVELMLDRLAKSQNLDLFSKEKGMFDKKSLHHLCQMFNFWTLFISFWTNFIQKIQTLCWNIAKLNVCLKPMNWTKKIAVKMVV